MLTKDFVSHVFLELEKIRKLPSIAIDYRNDPFIKCESQFSIGALEELLKCYEGSNEEATEENLGDFIQFLSERWRKNSHNDASYLHTPTTLANRACLLLATQLAQFIGKHPYELIMPTVNFKNSKWSRNGSFFDLKLQEMILLDDEATLIEVMYYIELIDSPQSKTINKFSNLEQLRIMSHSSQMHDYFMAHLANQDVVPYKNILSEAIKRDDYHVESNYREKSTPSLVRAIFPYIKNRNQLISVMTDYFPKIKWQEFLANIINEDFLRVMFNLNIEELIENDKKDFESVLSKRAATELNKVLQNPITHDRNFCALLFCLLEVYSRQRKDGDDFHSTSSYFMSFIPISLSYDKAYKLKACEGLKKFLLEEDQSIIDLEHFLAKESSYTPYAGAMKYGMLGSLLQHVKIFRKERSAGQEKRITLRMNNILSS